MKKSIALLLIVSLLLSGCAAAPAEPREENLSQSVAAQVISLEETPDCADAVAEVSLELLRRSFREGENTLLSPLSILAALGMTANGAAGETLAQMTDALGMTQQELNAWIYQYLDANSQLLLANSLWIRDDGTLTVEPAFLETNAGFYHGDVFQTAFDGETPSRINGWVAEKTDNQIQRILDSIPDNAMLYLVNALLFEALWEEPYEPYQVWDGTFTTETGEEQEASFMSSTESAYLETELATGFLKYYKDRDFAFAALLPAEGVTVAQLLDSMEGEALRELLSRPREAVVKAVLPKFETEYSAELADVLKAMGITDAFNPDAADFSPLGTSEAGNLFISQVRHKTAITVAEEGTKAAAATVVEMLAGAAFQPDRKFVTLDRPFVYMLIDCREQVPFFVGTLMDMSSAKVESPAAQTTFVPKAPPRLKLELDGESLVLDAGSYEWTVHRGRIAETVIACGAAPMDYVDQQPMAAAGTAPAQIFWEAENSAWNPVPDSLEACLWDPQTGETSLLRIKEEHLDLTDVSGIVQIKARWEEYGAAEYIFTLGNS